jgi:choline kinase
MSKDVEPARIDAENVGIVRFGRDGAAQLGTIVDALVASGHLRDWAPRAFAAFAREQPLYAIGTRGLPWTEIDTAEDYADAARRVYPAIREAVAEIAPALRRGA